MGMIRVVKGIVIGQLLVSVVAFGRLFRTFSEIWSGQKPNSLRKISRNPEITSITKA